MAPKTPGRDSHQVLEWLAGDAPLDPRRLTKKHGRYVLAALNKLEPMDRQILELASSLTVGQIAIKLGKKHKAIEHLLERATSNLKRRVIELLEGEDPE